MFIDAAVTFCDSAEEGEREGNCHFDGGHSSIDFQVYITRAIETRESVANDISLPDRDSPDPL